FTGHACYDEFAFLAVGKLFTSLGIDDLGIKVVLVDMETVLRLDALRRDARTDDFGKTIDVDSLDAQPFFDLVTHFVGPGLGPEETDAQLDRVEIDFHVASNVVDIQGERRCGADHRAPEVLQEQDLLLCITSRDWND